MGLHRRWMAAVGVFALGTALLFSLFAMLFVYAVEDRFLDRQLAQEAERQRTHWRLHGRYAPVPDAHWLIATEPGALPAEVAATLAADPGRNEVAGTEGRHYHLRSLQGEAGPPWLVAELGNQLIVRPIRGELFAWLAALGLATLALALALGGWLARRVTAPLEQLARRVAQAEPSQRPEPVAQGLPDDEVGAVARAFDALQARTHAFVAREQAFTRDASHELRTPLAVLRLQIERLQADPGTPPATRQALAGMHAATLLMEQTVQTLLLLAREAAAQGPGRPAAAVPSVPLLPLAEQWVVAHAGWLDQQRLSLALDLSRHDALPLPEPVLRLALASLLGNAFVHGTPGGVVRVALRQGALLVSNPSPAPPADATEPGRKGDESRGLGLGLAILQRLLQAHGARLELAHADGITGVSVHVAA
jgi:signal transduction histidine kinase